MRNNEVTEQEFLAAGRLTAKSALAVGPSPASQCSMDVEKCYSVRCSDDDQVNQAETEIVISTESDVLDSVELMTKPDSNPFVGKGINLLKQKAHFTESALLNMKVKVLGLWSAFMASYRVYLNDSISVGF